MKNRFGFFLLAGCILLSILAVPVRGASQLDGRELPLRVDDRAAVTVKAIQVSYPHHLWVSLRDMAAALAGTAKAFGVTVEPDPETDWRIRIVRGDVYRPVGGENAPFSRPVREKENPAAENLWIDGRSMRLPVLADLDCPASDAYLRLSDLCMYLDLALAYTGEPSLAVQTDVPYRYDLPKQVEEGYFHDLHGVLLGDCKSGEILFSHNANVPTQIASTTKLMTYLLVREAMDAGTVTEESVYTVSPGVWELACGEDGIYGPGSDAGTMDFGRQVSVRDLLYAMLLRSSNEAAAALAELVGGTESAFVTQMNNRAWEMGMQSAQFYNAHGLPDYSASAVTSKRQNEMSAGDMFLLVQYLLTHYRPHLTAITSLKQAELSTFGPAANGEPAFARNSNALLWNLEGCLGLKTGTTNRAGACLVSAIPVTDIQGQTHDVAVILFGGEDNWERYEKTAWLLRYAGQHFGEQLFSVPMEELPVTQPRETEAWVPETVPETAPKTPGTLPEKPAPGLYIGFGVLIGAGLAGGVFLLRKRS